MAASKETLQQVILVVVGEMGVKKALALSRRLCNETHGNASYNQTVRALYEALYERFSSGGL